MSLSSQSEMSSLLTEPQCDCCDDQSECMSTTASNFDYDADYVEISSSSDSDGPPLNISVQIGHRPNSKVINSRLPHARRVIRRDNKVLQAVSLPKLSSYNMRSLMPKIDNFGTDMEDRMCSL